MSKKAVRLTCDHDLWEIKYRWSNYDDFQEKKHLSPELRTSWSCHRYQCIMENWRWVLDAPMSFVYVYARGSNQPTSVAAALEGVS